MSATIDERIVEMRFDNKKFEKGAHESISTLSRLKEALNFSTPKQSLKELDAVAKGVNFDGISSSLQKLEERFSVMGIVGMRVIENLTDSMINMVKRGINYVSDSIISGGVKRAMNIENAHFQLQALLKDEKRVQAVMQNANDSVSGTAYAYDAAAKAASQFAASGIKEGEQMMTALRGIVGVAAMTNSEYEGIAMIFNTVAGNGRLMGDQLLQLSSRGLNAAATLSEYFNNVNSGAVKASKSITASIKSISKGKKVTEGDIRDLVSKGKISFDIFAESMNQAFGDSAFRANETFNGALSNIKAALARIGAGFVSPLVAQNNEVVGLFNAIREQVNNVKKALVFDESIGNVHALSKQVTDSLLSMAGSAAEFVKNADVTKPMELFYYGVEIVKNSAKGLWSVLKPLGSAFFSVFNVDVDNVIKIADKIESLTYKMKLSEEASQNLHDAAKGVSDVFKLLIDGAIKLVKVFIPINKPIKSVSGGILELAGAIGRGLTKFTELTRKSEVLKNVYGVLREAVSRGNDALDDSIDRFKELAGPRISNVVSKLKTFVKTFRTFEFPSEVQWLGKVRDALVDLYDAAKNLSFDQVLQTLRDFKEQISNLFKDKGDAKQITSFGDSMREFGEKLSQALKFDKITDNITSFRDALGSFATWVKDVIGPIFQNIPLGNIISSGTSISMILSLIKVSKTFESLGKGLTAIPTVFGTINTTLQEYQKSLKATVIVKIAASIAILAGALALLSFLDTSKLYSSAIVLTLVSAVFLKAISTFLTIKEKSKPMVRTVNGFADLLSDALNSFSKALSIRAIGATLKDFGIMVALIVGSIAALTILFKKDEENVKNAVFTLGVILAAMAGFMIIGTIFGKRTSKAGDGLVKEAASIYIICAALGKVVSSMGKLFKMNLPDDYKVKLAILAGLLSGIAALTLIIAAAGKLSGDGKFKTASLLGVTLSLVVVVGALSKLFKLELPSDYKVKLGILTGIFVGMISVILALGKAAKSSKGVIKAGGTLLALSAFLVTIVGSLMILSIIPAKKLLSGALTIGTILISLGVSLTAASKVMDKNVAKSVLAVALSTFFIVTALSALTVIDEKKLLTASAALSSVLLSIGGTLYLASKNRVSLKSVLALATILLGVGAIADALSKVAENPWNSIYTAGIAMNKVIIALGVTFKAISSFAIDVKIKTILAFLLMCTSLALVTAALSFLGKYDWKSLLAGGVALSGVILAMSAAFTTISKSKTVDKKKIGNFLLSGLAMAEIVVALKFLTSEPIPEMLASAVALSGVILAMSAAFMVIGKAQNISIKKIGDFLLMCLSLYEVVGAIALITNYPIDKMLSGATALSGVILALSTAFMLIGNSKDISIAKIGNFLLANLALYEAVGAIVLLTGYPIDKMLAAAVSLSLLITAMGLAFKLVGKADVGIETGAAFILGAVALIAITQAMLPLMDYDVEGLTKVCIALGAMLIEMSAAMAICAVVGKMGSGAAIEGMKSLLIFLAGFSAVLLALGALLDNDTAKSLISGGAEVLSLIGGAIGEFIGSIVGGVLEGISNSLPGIADNMVAFMEHLMPFFDYVGKIPDNALDDCKTLLGIIGLFTVAEFLSSIANLIDFVSTATGGGGLVGLADHLTEFAQHMQGFYDALSGYPSDAFEAGKKVAEMLLMFTKSELINGIAEMFFGKKSFADFAEELKAMGPAIVEFAESVKGINSDQVEGAASAVGILAEASKNLYGTGGIIQTIFGEKSLKDFADQLVALAPALVTFVDQTRGITESDIEGAVAAASMLSDLANSLPPQDGWVNKVFGTKSLKEFATQLNAFAPSLVSFVGQVTGITESDVSGAVNAAQLLSDLANTLPKSGDWYNKVFGTKSLEDFADQLDEFGPSISSFAANVNGITENSVTGAVAAAKVLLALSNELPDTGAFGGFFDWLAGKQDLGDFGEKLADFGGGMWHFHDSIKDIDVDHMNGVIDSIYAMIAVAKDADGIEADGLTNLSKAMNKMAEKGISGFVSTFTDNQQTITDALVDSFRIALTGVETYLTLQKTKDWIRTITDKFFPFLVNLIAEYNDDIKGAGEESADQWGIGYDSKYLELLRVVDDIIKKLLTQMQKRYPDFYKKGETSMTRYISGMKSKTNDAVKAITDLISKIMDEFQKKLPKWEDAGKDAGQGFIDGIKSKYGDAARAGESLAEIMLEAVTATLDIQSPSKVMLEVGSFVGEGFVNGITGWFHAATQTGDKLGNSTTDALKIALAEVAAMFDDEEIYDPVIKPLVNLDDVNSSVKTIAEKFNQALEISRVNAGDISFGMRKKQEPDDDGSTSPKKPYPVYQFTQNNYSPKALNRSEIYRDTKNVFSQFRGAVT